MFSTDVGTDVGAYVGAHVGAYGGTLTVGTDVGAYVGTADLARRRWSQSRPRAVVGDR